MHVTLVQIQPRPGPRICFRTAHSFLRPWQPQLLHLHRKLQYIINTLTLRLRLMHIIPPHIDPMPPHKHRIRIGILLHRRLQTLRKILLVRRILDNRYPQPVKVAQVADFISPLGYTFDLLDLLDFETGGGPGVALDEEGDEDGPLGVRVDAAAGAALEGCVEEGGAGGGFVDLGGGLSMSLLVS